MSGKVMISEPSGRIEESLLSSDGSGGSGML